jgi:predicted RNA-binding protein with PIN domain
MPLLIDGHNLIAHLPDLHLDDPDDEAHLIERLRRYQARTGKRLTVVFDQGLPGGPAPDLSTGKVKVIFAPTGRSADGLIVSRVRHNRDARGLTVVTSDGKIIAAVERYGATVVRAEAFAAELSAALAPTWSDEDTSSQSEIDEWLTLFGEANQSSSP